MEARRGAAGANGDTGCIYAHDFLAKGKVFGEEEVGDFFEVNDWLHRILGRSARCSAGDVCTLYKPMVIMRQVRWL